MDNQHYIYALCHPETGEVRYIGRTDNLQRRFDNHVRGGFGKRRNKWIEGLLEQGAEPSMVVLHTCDESTVQEWENRIFLDYVRRGARLTNKQGVNLSGSYYQVKIRGDQGDAIKELAAMRGITFSMMARLLVDIALETTQEWGEQRGVCINIDNSEDDLQGG